MSFKSSASNVAAGRAAILSAALHYHTCQIIRITYAKRLARPTTQQQQQQQKHKTQAAFKPSAHYKTQRCSTSTSSAAAAVIAAVLLLLLLLWHASRLPWTVHEAAASACHACHTLCFSYFRTMNTASLEPAVLLLLHSSCAWQTALCSYLLLLLPRGAVSAAACVTVPHAPHIPLCPHRFAPIFCLQLTSKMSFH